MKNKTYYFASLACVSLLASFNAYAEDVKFRYPIDAASCPGGVSLSAYFDQGSVTDYTCGKNSYSGHKGTDYAPYGGFNTSCTVVAAAPGTVVSRLDGLTDMNTSAGSSNAACSDGSKSYGNFVRIKHEDGTHTVYAHMKNGSVLVQKGDTVTCGQPLGIARSSGCSTGVHLHFDVSTSASSGNRYDPYYGNCQKNTPSRWVSQGNYNGMPGASCQCTPSCTGKTCGDDGCGGSCGTCDTGLTCTSSNTCGCVGAPITGGGTFKDIKSGSDNEKVAVALKNNNITSGCSTSPLLFCPDCPLSRLHAAMFIARALGYKAASSCSAPFTDVSTSSVGLEGCSLLKQLKDAGYISGDGSGKYRPNDYMSRAEAASLLAKTFFTPENYTSVPATFNDVPTSKWYFPYVEALARECVTNGCGSNNFCPDDTINRMGFATFLARAKGYVTKSGCLNTVECTSAANCTGGKVCVSNKCVECASSSTKTCEGNSVKQCVDNTYKYTACGANKICQNGVCENKAECSDAEGTVCSGNSVKACVNGAYQFTACGTSTCHNGACVACVSGSTPNTCQGNTVKSCINNQYQYTTCASNETCTNGKCVANAVSECTSGSAATCEGNNIKICINDKINLTSCDNLTCVNGRCVDCTSDYVPSCSGNSVKSCVNHQYQYTPCTNGTICDGGMCVTPAECTQGTAPTCDGDNIKSCVNGKYQYTKCDNACHNGTCTDCTDTFSPTCQGNAVKSCVDHQFSMHPCAENEICASGVCVPTTACSNDFMPICDGNNIKSCDANGNYVLTACKDGEICKNANCETIEQPPTEENPNPDSGTPDPDSGTPDPDSGTPDPDSNKPNNGDADNNVNHNGNDSQLPDMMFSESACAATPLQQPTPFAWLAAILGTLGFGILRRRKSHHS